MKPLISRLLLLALLLATSACGGGSGGSDTPDWLLQPYDVSAGKSFNTVFQEISAQSGVSFSIDPELQAKIDEQPPTVPILLGLKVSEVLTLVQDTMPQDLDFLYEELSPTSYLLRPRFQRSEDQSAATPAKFVDFDTYAQLGIRLMISEPQIEESSICGGPGILDELGLSGIFEIVTEVESDTGGHAPFIGEFPPLVEYSIEGNQISISGNAPWVAVSGEIQDDGSFSCAGSGTVAGFPDVTVDFLGQAQPGLLTGTLTVGAGGELPGGTPAIYSVHP